VLGCSEARGVRLRVHRASDTQSYTRCRGVSAKSGAGPDAVPAQRTRQAEHARQRPDHLLALWGESGETAVCVLGFGAAVIAHDEGQYLPVVAWPAGRRRERTHDVARDLLPGPVAISAADRVKPGGGLQNAASLGVAEARRACRHQRIEDLHGQL
jgi:hypothetical protein